MLHRESVTHLACSGLKGARRVAQLLGGVEGVPPGLRKLAHRRAGVLPQPAAQKLGGPAGSSGVNKTARQTRAADPARVAELLQARKEY